MIGLRDLHRVVIAPTTSTGDEQERSRTPRQPGQATRTMARGPTIRRRPVPLDPPLPRVPPTAARGDAVVDGLGVPVAPGSSGVTGVATGAGFATGALTGLGVGFDVALAAGFFVGFGVGLGVGFGSSSRRWGWCRLRGRLGRRLRRRHGGRLRRGGRLRGRHGGRLGGRGGCRRRRSGHRHGHVQLARLVSPAAVRARKRYPQIPTGSVARPGEEHATGPVPSPSERGRTRCRATLTRTQAGAVPVRCPRP